MFVPTGTASVTSLAWSGRTGESTGKIGCGEGKVVKKKERGEKNILQSFQYQGWGEALLKALDYIPNTF